MDGCRGSARQLNIWEQIVDERDRQEALKAAGKFRYTCADTELGDTVCGLVLGEEYGEVCRAVLNNDTFSTDWPTGMKQGQLRCELIQVAAVAVAWIEKLDKRKEQKL